MNRLVTPHSLFICAPRNFIRWIYLLIMTSIRCWRKPVADNACCRTIVTMLTSLLWSNWMNMSLRTHLFTRRGRLLYCRISGRMPRLIYAAKTNINIDNPTMLQSFTQNSFNLYSKEHLYFHTQKCIDFCRNIRHTRAVNALSVNHGTVVIYLCRRITAIHLWKAIESQRIRWNDDDVAYPPPVNFVKGDGASPSWIRKCYLDICLTDQHAPYSNTHVHMNVR